METEEYALSRWLAADAENKRLRQELADAKQEIFETRRRAANWKIVAKNFYRLYKDLYDKKQASNRMMRMYRKDG